jgi:hypothetical protein
MDVTVTLPRTFADDHEARECATGEVVRRSARTTTYRITDRDTFDDWLSDANYYSDQIGFDFEGMRAVCRSARRTLEILEGIEL